MIKICLDANIFIDAYNDLIPWYKDIKEIFSLAGKGNIEIYVSLQTLEELKEKEDSAYKLAKTVKQLPHWPIGSWKEQVGSWNDAVGSWNDVKENDEIQFRLEKLAKSGNDIRDRGAFIDALKFKINYFVTSDGQIVKEGPKERINGIFDTKVIKPKDLMGKLNT
jgi:predicted nucleic acid-binding protein